MKKYRLDIEYRGTKYHGWQTQQNARTVADELNKVLKKVFEDAGELYAAGRTDAGVHALHQVAHVEAKSIKVKKPPVQVLNDLLPLDIAVLKCAEVPEKFHARFDATERVYLYQILTRRAAFGTDMAWWIKDRLNIDAMREAAKQLKGAHDFASFCDMDPEAKKSTRLDLKGIELALDGPLILLRFRAHKFLWKMARRLTAFITECGRGRMQPGDAQRLFAKPCRDLAPLTAPPGGLYLERVLYKGETYEAPLKAVLGLK
jgi:tRNA pseudouridine38-40 synthase